MHLLIDVKLESDSGHLNRNMFVRSFLCFLGPLLVLGLHHVAIQLDDPTVSAESPSVRT